MKSSLGPLGYPSTLWPWTPAGLCKEQQGRGCTKKDSPFPAAAAATFPARRQGSSMCPACGRPRSAPTDQRTDASWVLALRSHGGPFVGHWPLGPHHLCSPPAHGLLALWARASPLALSLGTAPAAWVCPTLRLSPAPNPHSASKRFPQGRETSAAMRVSPGALPEGSDLCPPTPASQALGSPDLYSFQPPALHSTPRRPCCFRLQLLGIPRARAIREAGVGVQ